MVDEKYLNEILAIHPKLLKKIRKAGAKTGSKVFGGWQEGSDIDFIMPPDFHPDFLEALDSRILCYQHAAETDEGPENEFDHYYQDGFRSGYLKTDAGTVINLLWMQTEDAWRKWVEATAILKDLVEKYPTIAERMQDKKARVRFFEMLKAMLS